MSKIGRDDVMLILGRIDDVKLAEVMALEPTKDEIIQAKLWLTQTDLRDAGALGKPSGKVIKIFDMLRNDTSLEWEE
jgi:hypothetical protein